MSKRRELLTFVVLLALLLVGIILNLPEAPSLPETLEQDSNGWYWGEGQESLAAAVPEEGGLTVFWVEKADPGRLFYKKCKTADPVEALKQAAKLPLYTPELNWEPSRNHRDSALMDAAAMSLFQQANAQGNGGLSVGRFQLPRNTHKAGFALLTAMMLEVTPRQALDSMEENVWEGVWSNNRLTQKQEFYYYRGLVNLQWYNLWGTTADVEHRGSTDARDHLYVIENAPYPVVPDEPPKKVASDMPSQSETSQTENSEDNTPSQPESVPEKEPSISHEEATNAQYDEIWYEKYPDGRTGERFALIRKGNYWGLADGNGNAILEPETHALDRIQLNTYEEVWPILLVQKDGYWGAIDYYGNLVIEPNWQHIQMFIYEEPEQVFVHDGERWWAIPLSYTAYTDVFTYEGLTAGEPTADWSVSNGLKAEMEAIGNDLKTSNNAKN